MNELESRKEENRLVFINKEDVFTNSKIIADCTGIRHDKIKAVIEKHKNRLKNFGKLSTPYRVESYTGGRNVVVYDLNEPQATFLITLLKNTDKILDFKEELVRQFFEMREELRKRKAVIPIYMETRRNLTDSIKSLPDSEHKIYKYKHYTDMIYKIVLGMTATQKRHELGISEKQKLNLFLPYETLQDISMLSNEASNLIDMGFTYEQIKSGLCKLYEKINQTKNEEVQLNLFTQKRVTNINNNIIRVAF